MRFYTNKHPFYCGIDLHVRSLYVCILEDDGQTVLHKEIKAKPEPFFDLLTPYLGNVQDRMYALLELDFRCLP